MTGTGTVVELPVRRSCTADADTAGREPAGPTHEALSSARRLQLLQRLQAMLPPE